MLKILDIWKDENSYGAVSEPITLAKAKKWCLIDFTDDDDLILDLITQSRQSVENFCNISIVPKSIFLTATCSGEYVDAPGVSRWDRQFYGVPFVGCWEELPYGPVSAVQSVTNVDGATATILTENADYFLTGQGFKLIRFNSYTSQLLIQYSTPYYCPDALKEAILNEVAFRYENRGNSVNRYAAQNVGVSEGAEALAKPYQRIWL